MNMLERLDAFLVKIVTIVENLDFFNYIVYSFDNYDYCNIVVRGKFKTMDEAKYMAVYWSKFTKEKTFKIYKGFVEVK